MLELLDLESSDPFATGLSPVSFDFGDATDELFVTSLAFLSSAFSLLAFSSGDTTSLATLSELAFDLSSFTPFLASACTLVGTFDTSL